MSRESSLPGGSGGFIMGLATGLVIGGIAVMLYAPKSGPETRNLFREEYDKTQQMLQCWANDIRTRAEEISRIIRFRGEQEATVAGNGQKLHEL